MINMYANAISYIQPVIRGYPLKLSITINISQKMKYSIFKYRFYVKLRQTQGGNAFLINNLWWHWTLNIWLSISDIVGQANLKKINRKTLFCISAAASLYHPMRKSKSIVSTLLNYLKRFQDAICIWYFQ